MTTVDPIAILRAALDGESGVMTNGAGPDAERAAPTFDALIELNERRGRPGGAVLDESEVVESCWGTGHQSLWARHEPFLMAGPDGVGKTSLGQQLGLARIGVRPPTLLGFDVEPVDRLLYLACDRPSQAKRSMRRMVSEADRAQLDERLVIWEGPLPFDLAAEPAALLSLARHLSCDAVILDAVKDVAADLSREETGLGLNRSFQLCVADGIDVLALHHQRKAQAGAGKPNRLSDVYGSRWIPAGCGSVVMLWGEAGDPVVELTHLKQPDETIGPLQVVHDHITGTSTLVDHVDAYTIVMGSTNGVTASEVASLLYGDGERNATEKARRRLDRLTSDGKVHREGGTRGGSSGGEPVRYYPISLLHQGGGDVA